MDTPFNEYSDNCTHQSSSRGIPSTDRNNCFQGTGDLVLARTVAISLVAGRVRDFHLYAAGPIKIGDRYETRNQIPFAEREIYNADGIGVILD